MEVDWVGMQSSFPVLLREMNEMRDCLVSSYAQK